MRIRLPTLLAAISCMAFVLFTLVPAHAATTSEFQIWTGAIVQTQPRADHGLATWLDLAARRMEDGSLSIVRPGIGYQIARTTTLHVGYAAISRFPDAGDTHHEHRVWQQLVWTDRLHASLNLMLRPRLEQRFVEDDSLGHRARLFARAIWSPVANAPIVFVAWNEFFYQLNDTRRTQRAGSDQNRLFLGIGLTTTYGLRLELGYLNVYVKRTPDDQDNHNLFINLVFML